MNNKTCGDCCHFNRYVNVHCWLRNMETHPDNQACEEFEQFTNGDKIRLMSNEEFANTYSSCKTCVYRNGLCFDDGAKNCVDGNIAWLNAPAESEGEDE